MDQVHSAFLENGGLPTPQLSKSIAQACRTCDRCLGPPKHGAALPLDRVPDLPSSPTRWVPNGPGHPRRCLLVGCWWLIREIELSNTVIDDVHVVSPIEIRWNLPASKSDPGALGTARTHRCACGQAPGAPQALSQSMCPPCNLKEQWEWATSQAQGKPGLNLFPSATGEMPSKRHMVQTIQHAAELLKLPLTTPSGRPAWGGHALRRGGAQ